MSEELKQEVLWNLLAFIKWRDTKHEYQTEAFNLINNEEDSQKLSSIEFESILEAYQF